MNLFPVLLAAAATTTSPSLRYARVSSVSTTQLATICSGDQTNEADYCSGYILASYDQLSIAERICPPEGATTGQAVAVGKKYIAEHPELWSNHPASVLFKAFQATFPCR